MFLFIHFQVPKTLKNLLTFGSFDASFGPKVESVIDHHDNVDAAESSIELKQASSEPKCTWYNIINLFNYFNNFSFQKQQDITYIYLFCLFKITLAF